MADVYNIKLGQQQVWPKSGEYEDYNIKFFYPFSDLKDHKNELGSTGALYDLTGTNYTQNDGYITMNLNSRIVSTATNIQLVTSSDSYSFGITLRNMSTQYSNRTYQASFFMAGLWSNDTTGVYGSCCGINNGYNKNNENSGTPYPREPDMDHNKVAELNNINFTSSNRIKYILIWDATTNTTKWYKDGVLVASRVKTPSSSPQSGTGYIRIGYGYYQNLGSDARKYIGDVKNFLLTEGVWGDEQIQKYLEL